MPWTLYRYILREVLKVLLLSTAVLVVVIGFAAAIKPLSDGLLSATGMVKFIIYSMPTMLGLALPFAAAFAGTLVFCRMATDNEIIACRASGLSYYAILIPIACLGLVLTLSIFYLSNWVVPRFYLLAQQQVERDMVNVLVRQVEKHQTMKRLGVILYADRADDTQPPPKIPGDLQPNRLLILQGVAVGKVGKDGTLRRESTAQQADVLFFRDGDRTKVVIKMENAMVYDADTGDFGFSKNSEFLPMVIPNPFKDRLSFLSYDQLGELSKTPEQFNDVREKKQALAEAMTREELLRKIEAELKSSSRRGVTILTPIDGQKYIITAPKVERTKEGLTLTGVKGTSVRVETLASGVPVRRVQAESGAISVEIEDAESEPRVKIELQRVGVFDSGVSMQHIRFKPPRGRWPEDVLGPRTAMSTVDLVDLALKDYNDAPKVRSAADALLKARMQLGRKIWAKLHERAASATGCVLVLLLGAVLSMHLRGQMPLVVYFWSFLLAALAIVITHTGENLATDKSHALMVGQLLIWSGDIVLAAAITGIYVRLSRN